MTVNYLLQRIERDTGLVILTSNLESAIDSAFSRRLSASVYFLAPSLNAHIQRWNILKPKKTSLGEDVDAPNLAKEHALSGAQIRNALMRAQGSSCCSVIGKVRGPGGAALACRSGGRSGQKVSPD